MIQLWTCPDHGEWTVNLEETRKCSVCGQQFKPVAQGDLVWVMPLYREDSFRGVLTYTVHSVGGITGQVALKTDDGRREWITPFILSTTEHPVSIDITAKKDEYEVAIVQIPIRRLANGKLLVDPPGNVVLEVIEQPEQRN